MAATKKPLRQFWEHMHYVAFSRCRSLTGLHIVNINPECICVSPKVQKYLTTGKCTMTLCYTPSYAVNADIKIAFNNVCSLQNKWSVVSQNHLITNTDVIILAETWLSSRTPENMYVLHNFVQTHMDSTITPGHRGLLMYTSHTPHCVKVQNEHFEALLLTCDTPRGQFQIIGLYKPPTTCLDDLQ